MCGVTLKDKVPSVELGRRLGVEGVVKVMRYRPLIGPRDTAYKRSDCLPINNKSWQQIVSTSPRLHPKMEAFLSIFYGDAGRDTPDVAGSASCASRGCRIQPGTMDM